MLIDMGMSKTGGTRDDAGALRGVEGRHAGLPLFESIVLLGRERTLARLRAARERLTG